MFNVQFSGEENLTTEQLAVWVNETLGLSGPDQYSAGNCLAIYFIFGVNEMITKEGVDRVEKGLHDIWMFP